MPLRRRRPIARIATTAVVAGTAANMGAKSAQRSAAAAQPQAAPAPAPESAAPEPAAPESAAPEAAESPEIEQLKQYAALKDQGILTEEEFSAKKAQILGL
jgi:Short C-terminal domain